MNRPCLHFACVLSAFLPLLLSTATRSSAATPVVWTNENGGAWSAPSNWSPNQVPGAAHDAVITAPGNYTVTLDASATVASLTLGGAAGEQVLLLNNEFTLNLSGPSQVNPNGLLRLQRGTVGGSGLLTVDGVMEWTGGRLQGPGTNSVSAGGRLLIAATNEVRLAGRTLDNHGQVAWTLGQFNTDGAAVINNAAGAVFDIGVDGNLTGGRTFNNAGQCRKTNGPGTLTLTATFNNTGTVEVRTGTLSLSGGGVHTGSFSVATNATLALVTVTTNSHRLEAGSAVAGDGRVTFSGIGTNGVIEVNGTYDVRGATAVRSGVTVNFNPASTLANVGGTLAVSGGTANFSSMNSPAVNVTHLQLTGGTLTGTNVVAAQGPMIWNNNVLSGSGDVLAFGGVAINGPVSLSGRTLHLESNIVWSAGAIQAGANAALIVRPGATFELTFDGALVGDPAGPTPLWNAGTFRKTGGNGFSALNCSFTNLGLVELRAGFAGFAAFSQTDTNASTRLRGGNLAVTQPLQLLAGLLEGPGVIGATVTNASPQGIRFAAAPGLLTISDDYIQTAAGALFVRLPDVSAAANALSVGGNASLDGYLDIAIDNAYAPPANSSYVFLSAAGVSGGIAAYTFPSNRVGIAVVNTATEARINIINTPPQVTAVTNQTIAEQLAWTQPVVAVDDDLPPQTLTFELVQAPPGATNDAAGVIHWTPSEAQGPGSYPFTMRIVDNGTPPLSNSVSFTNIVYEVNVAPTLSNLVDVVIPELTPFALTLTNTAFDPDEPGNHLSFALLAAIDLGTLLPLPNVSFDPTNGALAWTPTEFQGPSTNRFTVQVADDGFPPLVSTYTFLVVVEEVNAAPAFVGGPNPAVSVTELNPLVFTNLAADVDYPTNTLTFELLSLTGTNGPVALVNPLDPGSGVFTWTPGEEHGRADYTARVRVYDNGNPLLSATQSVTITVFETNSAPTWRPIPDTNWFETVLNTLNLSNFVDDVDLPNNPLTIRLVAATNLNGTVITNLLINTNTGVLSWYAEEHQSPSTNVITVRVTDFNAGATVSQQLSATNSFTIVLFDTNSPPVFGFASNYFPRFELTALSITNAATDTDRSPDPDVLTYELLSLTSNGVPATLANTNFNPASGVLSWTPAENEGPGTYEFTMRVSDNYLGAPLLATNVFTVAVLETNAAPTITPPFAAVTNVEGALVVVPFAAADDDWPDNDLVFSLVSATNRNGLAFTNDVAIDPVTGLLSWTPAECLDGTNVITVRVTDFNAADLNPGSQRRAATTSVTVFVRETNNAPPVVVNPPVPNARQAFPIVGNPANQSTNFTLHFVAEDVDCPERLTWRIVGTTNYALGGSSSERNQLFVRQLTNGLGSFRFTVGYNYFDTDAVTNGFSRTFTFAVDDGGPPVLSTTQMVTFVFTNQKSPPQIVFPAANQAFPVVAGSALRFTNVAYDVDHPRQGLAFALLTANVPPGARLTNNTPPDLLITNNVFELATTADQAGATYTNAVIVTDSGGLRATQTFIVSIVGTNNTPPRLMVPTNDVLFAELVPNQQLLTTEDDEQSSFFYSLLSPTDLGIDLNPTTGELNWTPTEEQGPATNQVTVRVSDGDATDTRSFTLVVLESNAPPVFAWPPDGRAFGVVTGATVFVTNIVIDPDRPTNALTLQFLNLPAGATTGDLSTSAWVTNVFSWTPTAADVGYHAITNVATDNNPWDATNPQLSTTNTFVVIVREANAFAPVVTVPPTNVVFTELVPNQTLPGAVAATDLDVPTNILTFELLAPPSPGLAIDPRSGVITWEPTEAEGRAAPAYSVTVRVTDDGEPPLSGTNTLVIAVDEVNTPPVIAVTPDETDFTISAGFTLSVTNTATDEDLPANTLTFSVDPLLAGVSMNGGVFSWTPLTNQVGLTTNFTVTVSDGGVPLLLDSASFSVTVEPQKSVDLAVVSAANGEFVLQVSGDTGLTYILQGSTNLASPANWVSLLTNRMGTTPFNFTNDMTSSAIRFYQVKLEP